jgi:hypothetical protein
LGGDVLEQCPGSCPPLMGPPTQAPFVVDVSHFGLLSLTGEDRLRFLHNQV